MKVPGVLYSLLLALGAWAVDLFTTGDLSTVPWSAIALAAIPVILKMFTVQAPPEPTPMSDVGGPAAQPDSKMKRFLLG